MSILESMKAVVATVEGLELVEDTFVNDVCSIDREDLLIDAEPTERARKLAYALAWLTYDLEKELG
jgi:hypothetical protein